MEKSQTASPYKWMVNVVNSANPAKQNWNKENKNLLVNLSIQAMHETKAMLSEAY